jgi:4-hydroxybenzoate polyprenyltransferase
VGAGLLFRIPGADRALATIFITVVMTQFSISAMNEWADRERDAAANRRRPVALGWVRPQTALALALLFGLAALPGALSFGLLSLILVIAGLGIGWAYDLVLKPTPLSFIPFAIAFPLLLFWVGVLAGRPPASLLFLFVAGAPLAIAIHLADAIPDRDVDRDVGIHTLAVALGRPAAEVAAAAGLLIAGLLTLGRLVWTEQLRSILWSVFLAALTTMVVAGSYLTAMLGSSLIPFSIRQRSGKWVLIVWASVLGFYAVYLIARG